MDRRGFLRLGAATGLTGGGLFIANLSQGGNQGNGQTQDAGTRAADLEKRSRAAEDARNRAGNDVTSSTTSPESTTTEFREEETTQEPDLVKPKVTPIGYFFRLSEVAEFSVEALNEALQGGGSHWKATVDLVNQETYLTANPSGIYQAKVEETTTGPNGEEIVTQKVEIDPSQSEERQGIDSQITTTRVNGKNTNYTVTFFDSLKQSGAEGNTRGNTIDIATTDVEGKLKITFNKGVSDAQSFFYIDEFSTLSVLEPGLPRPASVVETGSTDPVSGIPTYAGEINLIDPNETGIRGVVFKDVAGTYQGFIPGL